MVLYLIKNIICAVLGQARVRQVVLDTTEAGKDNVWGGDKLSHVQLKVDHKSLDGACLHNRRPHN